MIAHVAEASEASGRVVLWLNQGFGQNLSSHEASIRVAAAYGSELETVIIEAQSLTEIAGLPVRFVSKRGKTEATVPSADRNMSVALANVTARQYREIDRSAAKSGVSVSHAQVNGDVIDRLAQMCLERGPWNIIAVPRSSTADLAPFLSSIFANVSGATGVVISGSRSSKTRADVAIVVEDTERMPSMVRAAERLVMAGGKIHVLIAAETTARYLELDSHARLLMSDAPLILYAKGGATFGVSGTLDESLGRLHPSFIIARYGGTLLPQARALSRLLSISPAPLLLVR